jgi:hypothetical protein
MTRARHIPLPPETVTRAAAVALLVTLFTVLSAGVAPARMEESPAATVLRLHESATLAVASWSTCPDVEAVTEEVVCLRTELWAAMVTRSGWEMLLSESVVRVLPDGGAEPVSARHLSGVATGTADAQLTRLQVVAELQGVECRPGDEWDEDWGWRWECHQATGVVEAAWEASGPFDRSVHNQTPGGHHPGPPFISSSRGAHRPADASASIDGEHVAGVLGEARLSMQAEHILQVCRGGDWDGRNECRSSN